MPLLQAIVEDVEVERLDRYRQGLKFPTTKTAIMRTALREWLDARETEQEPKASDHPGQSEARS